MDKHDEKYDIVYTTEGVLCWLPDLFLVGSGYGLLQFLAPVTLIHAAEVSALDLLAGIGLDHPLADD